MTNMRSPFLEPHPAVTIAQIGLDAGAVAGTRHPGDRPVVPEVKMMSLESSGPIGGLAGA